jgi:hypothetical protein
MEGKVLQSAMELKALRALHQQDLVACDRQSRADSQTHCVDHAKTPETM